ncbi:MAG: bifunctional 2-polyprenyl-6-hydroxyphenol methylase/3-demethylubiquinol 3-O-methyltransferase UbiG [Pseudomonadales bacterium]|jgi:2-polyprenyl-6-hydroxyphenyl methylase/3-demethylubiquinone-9 3-methyltransferase
MSNVDPLEIRKFEALAHRWWDPEGDFRPLHDINPARLDYIAASVPLDGARAVDVGCGGGLLAEAMARAGAAVTGMDMAERPLAVARLHAMESNVTVEYVESTAEALATERGPVYDVVTCLEMLEHVPDIRSTVKACADLARPGGHLFFSTINRNPKAWALAVVGAEYVLGLLPKGTHDYTKFIKPHELAAAVRDAGLEVVEVKGMRYNPFTRNTTLGDDVDVNYLLHARKPADG